MNKFFLPQTPSSFQYTWAEDIICSYPHPFFLRLFFHFCRELVKISLTLPHWKSHLVWSFPICYRIISWWQNTYRVSWWPFLNSFSFPVSIWGPCLSSKFLCVSSWLRYRVLAGVTALWPELTLFQLFFTCILATLTSHPNSDYSLYYMQ